MRDTVLSVMRKELAGFFASPVAYLFLASFLAVSLFVFFWVEAFFARNIADLKPLFQWMPVLLIFLVSALTMRLWSEERRSGTLELLLTAPVSPARLVLGKFLAAEVLVALALLLTAPLAVTVAALGPLDWGPVAGGYLAALLLGAAYIAIGLFVSARTDNAIVALIGTVALCGLFYLLGSDTVTALFGHQGAEWLRRIGTGSRFEAITRGVVDLRDLYYYLSLVGIFLALNVWLLERLRWARDGDRAGHRRLNWTVALLAANFLAANLWLSQIPWVRADLTENDRYSLSDTTRRYLDRLQEPLVIRGYFSAKTHPLLAPLVPQLRDLLREYAVAGGSRVRVEFVDPHSDPDIEREAVEKYGIRPVAFQTADRYQAAVVNSYFDVVVQYGDQFEKLGYSDLIEVKARGEGEPDVRLRNPEYDITRAVRKALYAYRGEGDLFDGLDGPVALKAFMSPAERLPEPLKALRASFEGAAQRLREQAGDRLTVSIEDPDASGGELARTLRDSYGFRPMALGLLDADRFWFYLVAESGGQSVPVPLPESLDGAGLERNLEEAIRRLKPGVLRTIALYTPKASSYAAGSYSLLEERLREGARLIKTDLADGRVPARADLLLVVDPSQLDEKPLFAIDQFLMQGGAVVIAGAPYRIDLSGGRISAASRPTGLEAWLEHHGLGQRKALVLDSRNMPFPLPVERNLGGFVVRELRRVAYPYFPDIRAEGMDRETGIVTGLGQITVSWAAPFDVDKEKNDGRRVFPLLRTSAGSWTRAEAAIQPDFTRYPRGGFPSAEMTGPHTIALAVEGRFTSYFKEHPAPSLGEEPSAEESGEAKGTAQVRAVVESSPPSARLILLGSGTMLSDVALDLAAQATGTRYLKPIRLVENAIDWSIEDRGLLALRGQGQYSRLLVPTDEATRRTWEYLNYGLALTGLFILWAVHRQLARRRFARYRLVLESMKEE